MTKTLSSSGEDYLKAIYKLRDAESTVSTQALAARLGVAPPSATAMVKKLATMKLVVHSPYRGVELTSSGEQIALEVIRHHRLVETYLSEVLGVAWDKVHDEAERWEHVLSEEVEAKMAEALGHPTRDPHGAPIPAVDGTVERDNWTRLGEAQPGTTWTMCRASDERGETLRHLGELGLVPGARVEVLRAAPEEGVLHLRVDGREQILGKAPADAVFVKPEEGE